MMRPRRRATLNSAKTPYVPSVLTAAEKKRGSRKLLVHEKVEVRKGLLGSWQSGHVLSLEDEVRQIIYDEILNDEGSGMVEDVKVSAVLDGAASEDSEYKRGKIRPLPPPSDLQKKSICYGLCVDVRFKDAGWREGVVFDHDEGSDERRVFFPDLGDEQTAKMDALRLSQDWDEASGEWRIRGEWHFLGILKEVASYWPLAASARQIWYEVQLMLGWVEWTHPSQDLWKWATRNALRSSYDLLMKQIVEDLMLSNPKDEDISISSAPSEMETDLSDVKADEVLSFPSILAQGNVVEPVKLELPKPDDDGFIVIEKTGPKEEGEDTAAVEKVFCPRAVLEYTQMSSNHESGRKKGAGGEEPLISKAKKHLSAVGWTFHYVKKRWNDKEKRELRYVSPDGKRFISLKSACKWYIIQGHHKPASSPLRHTARGQPVISSFKWFSTLDEPKQVHGISKGINLQPGSSKKAESPKKDDLFAAPQARSTLLARLIDADMVVAGAKVQYRSKGGVNMQEGRISPEGIICSCCDQVFKLSDFEVHAGSSNKRPSAHTFLEDGRSLAVCQSQLKCDK